MAEGNAKGTLIVVGLVAFILGRCSVEPDTTAPPSASAVAVEVDAPGAAQPLISQAEPTPTPPTRIQAGETTANPWTSSPATGVTEEPADDSNPVDEAEPVSEPAADVYYQNCAAVRAAGAAPLSEGEPGYAPKLDRDGDGVACE